MRMSKKTFWAFATPSVTLMFLLMIVPLILTIVLCFSTYTYGASIEFVGFRNFVNILSAPNFWDALFFTLILLFITIPLNLFISLSLAMILYKQKSKLIRTIFLGGALIPFAIAAVVSTMIFSWLFKDTSGLLTWALSEIGITPGWFSDPWAARALIVIHNLWGSVSFGLLVFYAGLQAMPTAPLLAAEVEGANILHRMRYVILPHLSPLFVFVTMMSVMDTFRTYDSVAILTRGGPGTATETLQFYAYKMAFGTANLGQGAAISMIMILFMIILLIPFLRRMYKENKEI